jgi:hypothetical protein
MIVAAGCGAPMPPQKVNAYLPGNAPVVQAAAGAADKADTLVLAKCVQSREYATTTAGDWVDSWYVTTWKVLRVERGKWPEEAVSFKFLDRWPLPKRGVPSIKPPMAYHVGAMRAFYIDTRREPTIVADEARSQIPPHGSVTRPKYDIGSPESEALYERISDAARAFTQKERRVTGPANVVEQYGHWFVVEVETLDDSFAVVVNDETMAVTWAESAEVPK